MGKGRHTEAQIIAALKQVGTGPHGMSFRKIAIPIIGGILCFVEFRPRDAICIAERPLRYQNSGS